MLFERFVNQLPIEGRACCTVPAILVKEEHQGFLVQLPINVWKIKSLTRANVRCVKWSWLWRKNESLYKHSRDNHHSNSDDYLRSEFNISSDIAAHRAFTCFRYRTCFHSISRSRLQGSNSRAERRF